MNFPRSWFCAQPKTARILIAFLACLLLWGGLTLGLRSALGNTTLGADFYTFWTAGRAAILDGQNPYSPEVSEQIQLGILGHAAQPGEDQLAFAYPAYSLFAIFPLLFLPFNWAQTAWLAFNLLAVLLVCFSLFPRAAWANLSLVTFYPFVFGLILGNYDVLTGLFLLAFLALFTLKKQTAPPLQILFGVLLAFATLKPQFSWLYLLFAALFTLRMRLIPLAVSFCASLTALVILPFLFIPNWINKWLSMLNIYTSYTHATDNPVQPMLLTLLQSAGLSNPLAILLLAASAVSCAIVLFLFTKRDWRTGNFSLSLLAWIGFVSYLFHPNGLSYEQITMLIPFYLWAVSQSRRRSVILFWLAGWFISWAAFAATLSGSFPKAVYAWPILFQFLWLLWLTWVAQNQKSKVDRLQP